MLQTSNCFHTVHKTCFVEYAKLTLSYNQKGECPECKAQLENYELKNYLSKDEIQKIEETLLKSYMEGNQNLATCPCGAVMEVKPGQVDF